MHLVTLKMLMSRCPAGLVSGIIFRTVIYFYTRTVYLSALCMPGLSGSSLVTAELGVSVGRVLDWGLKACWPAESLCCVLEQDTLSSA